MTALRTPLALLGTLALLAGCDATSLESSAAPRASAVSEVKVYTTSEHKVYQFETDGTADLLFDIHPFPGQPEEFEIASVFHTSTRDNEDYVRFYQEWDDVRKVFSLSSSHSAADRSRSVTVRLYRGPSWASKVMVAESPSMLRSSQGIFIPTPVSFSVDPGKSYHTNNEGDVVIDYIDGSGGGSVVSLVTTDEQGEQRSVAYSDITYVSISPVREDSSQLPNHIRIHVGRRANVEFNPAGSSFL